MPVFIGLVTSLPRGARIPAAAGAGLGSTVRRSHLNLMVIHMITVSVMQVAIVKIISVAVVFHGGVPAVWAMHVAVSP